MYLLDPDGQFVTFYGKNFTAQQLSDSIGEHMAARRGSAKGGSGKGSGGDRVGIAGSQEGRAQK